MGGALAGFETLGGERPALARAGHLLPFLLASMIIHGLFMAWSARAPQHLPADLAPRPLSVDLSFPAPAPEPFRPRQAATGRTEPRTAPAIAGDAPPLPIPNGERADHGETPSAPVVDIDAARSLARRIGREAKAGGGQPMAAHAGSAPPIEDRMAAAVARAYRPGTLVERQTNGGWVVLDGKRRCLIQPRDVPLFLQGMLIIPLCDA